MIQARRLKEIREQIEREGAVSVSELAKNFGKNPITIRRDLDVLASEGTLRRTHGGGVVLEGSSANLPRYDVRKGIHLEEKAAIAAKATQYISDGDSLIINAGTTTRELAACLGRYRDLQIVTNGITLVPELAHSAGSQVFLIGGETDFKKLGTVGPVAEEMIQDIHVAKAFIGVSGISLERGLLMHSPSGARINAAFVASADETTVLVDSSKFTSNYIYRVAQLKGIHRIITDAGVDTETRKALEQAVPEVVITKNY